MSNQHWFKIAGVSTILAGTVAAIASPATKPMAVLIAGTAGAAGGILLSAQPRSQTTKPKATATSYDNTGAKLTQLEQLLQQQHADLKAELRSHYDLPFSADSQNVALPPNSFSRVDPFSRVHPLNKLERLLLDHHQELAALNDKIQQPGIHGNASTKRAAILYDIENLIKGYNISQEILSGLSLKEILAEIQKKEQIGHVLVQQAFANWSDTRLRFLRVEINELGIDPIQVFGFAREQKKNAADIELVINAIDLAYIRSAIEVFVIVSGDGGFAALAKKLHEYGKTVIGCAYRNSASQTFRSVCDDFIWIPDPDEDERSEQSSIPTRRKTGEASPNRLSTLKKKTAVAELTNQESGSATISTKTILSKLNLQISDQLNQIKDLTQAQEEWSEEQLIETTKRILNLYTIHSAIQPELANSGINLSAVYNAVQYAIPNFKPSEIGFSKFADYMQYVCQGLALCIARVSISNVILALRESVPSGATVLPDLDIRKEVKKTRSEGLSATNFRLLEPLNQIKQTIDPASPDAIAITKRIFDLYTTDPIAQAELRASGYHVSVFQEAMKYTLPEFQPIQQGFAKFSEYLQYACKDTELCIGRVPPSNIFLFFRDALPENVVALPDLNPREIHSVETYRSVLATGSPVFRLPPPHELYAISAWMADHSSVKTDLGSLIEDLVTGLNGEISSEVIKFTLLSFLATDLFIREPEGVPLSEQTLTLRADRRSLKGIMQILKISVEEKLSAVLPNVHPAIVEQILPDAD